MEFEISSYKDTISTNQSNLKTEKIQLFSWIY
jgi:hypothetical protein